MTGLSDIPALLGVKLGITATNAGAMLSAIVLVGIVICISALSRRPNLIMTAAPLLAATCFLVGIAWLPIWVLFIIAVLVALYFAASAKGLIP